MSKYNKLIVAIVGLLVLVFGPEFLNLSPEGTFFGISQETVVQLVIAVLTAFGVYQVTNA